MFGELAAEVLRREKVPILHEEDQLLETPLNFETCGADHIEPGAVEQMRNAMRLPVAAAGALPAHLNVKAVQELLLFYLRERAGCSIQLRHLVVTNLYE